MKKLQPIRLDDQTVIYVEAMEDLEVPEAPGAIADSEEEEEVSMTPKGIFPTMPSRGEAIAAIPTIDSTIRQYTRYTLNALKSAFQEVGLAEVKKITLEFGVSISGVGGVPYIATGTAGCSLKVSVECAFPSLEE